MQRLSLQGTLPSRAIAAVALLALATLYAYYLHKPTLAGWTGLVAIFVAGFSIDQARKQPIALVINAEANELTVLYRPRLRTPSKRLPLSPFSLVRTYSRGSPLPVSVVELATIEELPRAVRIATFAESVSKEGRFLAVPRFVEAPAAKALRGRLAATGLFRDEGYLGEFCGRRAQDVA